MHSSAGIASAAAELMADQRRRFRGGGDWQASVDDVVDDGGELEAAAAAAAAARGSVLSGEYQAQEMSTMVSALTWVVAAGHDDHGGGQWSGLVDVPATTLAGGGGGDYGHGAQGSYYYYGAAPTSTPEFVAGEDHFLLFYSFSILFLILLRMVVCLHH